MRKLKSLLLLVMLLILLPTVVYILDTELPGNAVKDSRKSRGTTVETHVSYYDGKTTGNRTYTVGEVNEFLERPESENVRDRDIYRVMLELELNKEDIQVVEVEYERKEILLEDKEKPK